VANGVAIARPAVHVPHRCRIGSVNKEKTVKKIIPAVFFQKQLNGIKETPKKPERLALFEGELRAVVGGQIREDDGSGGTVTYSGSDGWLDVANADDCAP
jgi:hypothetical protein